MQIYVNIKASLQICHTTNKLGWKTKRKTARFLPSYSLSDILMQSGINRGCKATIWDAQLSWFPTPIYCKELSICDHFRVVLKRSHALGHLRTKDSFIVGCIKHFHKVWPMYADVRCHQGALCSSFLNGFCNISCTKNLTSIIVIQQWHFWHQFSRCTRKCNLNRFRG